MPEEIQERSFLGWMIEALGPYGLLIPLAGLATFALACIVVAKAKRPGTIGAFAVVAAAPFLIGLFGMAQGMLTSLSVIAVSQVAPKPSEVSGGIATALFSLQVGMLVAFPAYAVCCLGILVRTFTSEDA